MFTTYFMEQKVCTKCHIKKDVDQFRKQRTYCKKCESKDHHEYYIKNKEKITEWSVEYNKKYREKNIDKIEAYLNNPDVIIRYWAHGVLSGHRKKGNIINITVDDLIEMAKHVTYCPICGTYLVFERKNGYSPNHPSLDRVSNSNVLDKTNTWIICHKCNMTKQERTMPEFIAYCKTVVGNFG